jgi:ABC-2 type transport system ATP-binding protein
MGLRGDDFRGVEVEGLCKWCGQAVAVDHLSFTVRPGQVTGFLADNLGW